MPCDLTLTDLIASIRNIGIILGALPFSLHLFVILFISTDDYEVDTYHTLLSSWNPGLAEPLFPISPSFLFKS